MIKVNNNQLLIIYKKSEDKTIEYNIKMINENENISRNSDRNNKK